MQLCKQSDMNVTQAQHDFLSPSSRQACSNQRRTLLLATAAHFKVCRPPLCLQCRQADQYSNVSFNVHCHAPLPRQAFVKNFRH